MTRRKAPAKARKHKAPARKPATPAKSAKVSSERARPLQRGGRYHGTPYRATQADYAKTYGKSLPTIKRWWKEGKPLDDADAMGEYLSNRGRKAGARVTMGSEHPWAGESGVVVGEEKTPFGRRPRIRLDNGEEVFAMKEGDIEENTPSPPLNDDEETPVLLDESFFVGQGFLAAIERLKKAERERAAAYFSAIRQKLPGVYVQARFKEWTGCIEPLRKLAKDEPEIRKANELTIDKAEMEAAIAHIFNAYRQAARNLPTRAAGKIVGLKEHDEVVEALEAEIDVLFRALTKLSIEEAAAAKESEAGAQ